jgi:hypothetical protein
MNLELIVSHFECQKELKVFELGLLLVPFQFESMYTHRTCLSFHFCRRDLDPPCTSFVLKCISLYSNGLLKTVRFMAVGLL